MRYPAVVALGADVFSFGGETGSGAGSTVTATAVIQEIDPATHTVSVVGTLPQALYGAAAFVLDGHIYLAGGQTGDGETLTQIYEFDEHTHRVADAGLLPQAVAFGGYATVGTGTSAVGYIVGGEVAQQSGNDQAGVASGTLDSVISLRPSTYGGPVGGTGAGAPFPGHLLIADRGNDRLLVIDPARDLQWQYPSATMPPPPGGLLLPRRRLLLPQAGRGSSPTRRTTTPSSRSATRRARSSGSTGTPAARQQPRLPQPARRRLRAEERRHHRGRRHERPHPVPLARRQRSSGQIGTNGVAVHTPADRRRLPQRRHAARQTATSWYRRSTARGSTSTPPRASWSGRSTCRRSTTRPTPSRSAPTSTCWPTTTRPPRGGS